MKLQSRVFNNEEMIPQLYTCDGENISPPLHWEELPGECQSLALIVDDPDAPGKTFQHWGIYNVPSELKELPEHLTSSSEKLNGIKQCKNDFGRTNYGGPCPPSGTHRYFFKLYALDDKLDLKEDATISDLQKAMEGHVIESAELMAKYSRK
jgi:Raf kinase inhibitor-like YbhB/YbcL family protein